MNYINITGGKKYQRDEIVDEIVDNVEVEEVQLENE